MGLDENDVNILNVLQGNGRLSFRQVSERVRISVPTVSNKVSNLERMGVIRGYHAELDPERMGEISVMVTVKARPSELSEVARNFDRDDQVRQVFHLSSGRLLLVCTFIDGHMINDFAARLASIPQVLEYDIASVISVDKELDRAVVAPGVNPIMLCGHCGREIRDEPLRLRDSVRTHFLCSEECRAAMRSHGRS
ncbi:MAG: winged helix-turn-helix transcriptional regulator [Methanomassiliicoccus sp.]|nr:winged helix-turn-helix transcriptional regulator [Methanomassiliicoccus sp.]